MKKDEQEDRQKSVDQSNQPKSVNQSDELEVLHQSEQLVSKPVKPVTTSSQSATPTRPSPNPSKPAYPVQSHYSGEQHLHRLKSGHRG